jgi:protein SCO1/2
VTDPRTAAPNVRVLQIVLIALLVAVMAIPLTALWKAFGPKDATAPDFTLTDQDGRPFTLSSLRGHPVALMFGYASCPDECPTALSHLARAVHKPGVAPDVRVLFISVDPDRDTPTVLKRYVRVFDPAFVGLRGNVPTLDPILANYHTFRKVAPPEKGESGYSMEHGTAIYYIGRDGKLTGYGHMDDAVPTMADDLKKYG